MIDYVYKAKNTATGEVVSANVKAESPQAAAKLLMGQELFPLDITPQAKADILARLGLKRGVSAKDRVLFTRQLSTLINAGLPLAKALRTVEQQIQHQTFRGIIANIVTAVEGGSSLSDAFAQYPKVFNEIYIALVAAGETSGSLDKTLLRLADQQEKDAAILSQIRSAMIYPAIVLVIILAVVILMVVTVVPQVADLYASLHKALPLATQILIGLSNFLKGFWWLVVIAVPVVIYGFRKFLATEDMQYRIDILKLRLPIMGVIFRKMYMARFARTMSSLLASGIPMLQALETTRRAVTNRPLQADITTAIEKVRGGINLSEALEPSHYFLPLVPQMISIGEESGEIDGMMQRVAVYFENEVDEAVKNLSTTLEPVMMVVLGGIVALVLLAVLYPVYSLVGSGSIGATT
jgi:type IV pilus assembly protein PilC